MAAFSLSIDLFIVAQNLICIGYDIGLSQLLVEDLRNFFARLETVLLSFTRISMKCVAMVATFTRSLLKHRGRMSKCTREWIFAYGIAH